MRKNFWELWHRRNVPMIGGVDKAKLGDRGDDTSAGLNCSWRASRRLAPVLGNGSDKRATILVTKEFFSRSRRGAKTVLLWK